MLKHTPPLFSHTEKWVIGCLFTCCLTATGVATLYQEIKQQRVAFHYETTQIEQQISHHLSQTKTALKTLTQLFQNETRQTASTLDRLTPAVFNRIPFVTESAFLQWENQHFRRYIHPYKKADNLVEVPYWHKTMLSPNKITTSPQLYASGKRLIQFVDVFDAGKSAMGVALDLSTITDSLFATPSPHILNTATFITGGTEQLQRTDQKRWQGADSRLPISSWHTTLTFEQGALTLQWTREYAVTHSQVATFVSRLLLTTTLFYLSALFAYYRRRERMEKDRSLKALLAEKQRAEVTLKSIGDAVFTTDRNNLILYINPMAEILTGVMSKRATGRPLGEVLHLIDGATGQRILRPIAPPSNKPPSKQSHDGLLLRSVDGKNIHVHNTVSALRDSHGRTIGNVLVVHDISTERELSNALHYQATHDPLTGLANRLAFKTRLQALLTDAKQTGESHALCYIDLDQFKMVNDVCGHIAGDKLLLELTERLQQSLRSEDSLARLGGDEFGVLITNCSPSMATRLAKHILHVFQRYYFTYEDQLFNVRASIGVVPINQHNTDITELLSAADIACYTAKDLGRNRVHLYHPGDQGIAARHTAMRHLPKIERALREDRFVLCTQPIVPLQKQHANKLHCEFLLRMQSDEGGLVEPELFIDAAERYNLMRKLDRWVIDKTLSALAPITPWHPSGPQQTYAINLSGQSMTDPHLIRFIRKRLDQLNIDPRYLCFEITETAAIINLSHATDIITGLQELGCRFSLDDFGSGLSSFSYLKKLPVNYLKIDGQFIKELSGSEVDQAMVQSIQNIGRLLNIETIAEYVEDAQTSAMLTEMGVDYAQGYYLGKPSIFKAAS